MKDITIKLSAIFRKEFKRLAKKYRSLPFDLDKLIESIQENPMQGTDLGNRLRKIHLAITSKGKGKSSGARVITYTSFPQLFYPLMTRQFFCDFHEKSEDFCVS